MEGGYIENDNYDACGADSNGEQIINVTLKSIDDFEKELENSNQTWLYHFDVTAFGFWDYSDCYSIKTETAEGVISDYIKKGYGFITGHDSITSGFEDNENNAEGIVAIRKLFNVTVKDHDKDYFNYIESDKIEVHKQGLLLMYPWNLINRGEEDESINFSHTSHHKAHGDIWFSFASTPEYDTTKCNETDNFYLTTFGNTAMVQTGHTGSATSFERKILANTIFYLKQRTNETEFEDHYLNLPDTSQPEINDIVIDQANYLITIEANVGTQYTFKVVAYNGTGQSINESEVVVNVTKGIAHYNYTFSANANCELHDLTNITYENTIKFTTNDVVDQMYLHVAPTDNKNITGNITTVRLNFSTNTFSQSNTYSQSNTFTQSNSFSESNTFSQSNTFSESNTFTKSNSFTDSNSFSESNSFTSSFPFGASLSFSFILTIYSSDISSFTQIFRTHVNHHWCYGLVI
ncbi:bacterial Ig-like domain protein [Histomonas meleagridis]|nr:bacterial Ig-like domain protein [Histomonas meleagridis]